MTQRAFERIPRHLQTQTYFNHELNQGGQRGKNGSHGPSVVAQAAFVNNWQKAFHDFSDRLGSNAHR